MIPAQFGQFGTTTRRLLAVRLLRAIAQGALAVDFALYLNALGWSGTAIGLVLTAGGLALASAALLVGPLSDRIGRRRLLLGYQMISIASATVGLVTASPAPLAAAAIVGGFGRGANGSAGAFAPAEQAWLAEALAPEERARVFGWNSALGFFGMALGAIAAVSPAPLAKLLPGPLAYRPLFAVALLVSVAGFWLLLGAPESYRPRAAQGAVTRRTPARRRENRVLGQMVAMNALNGAAVGLIGPLMSYWFLLRFGVGPAAIGPVLALTFFVTGVASVVSGRVAGRIGIVDAVIGGRAAGLLLLVALPLMPTYPLAALVYLVRSVFNRGTAGVRQALVVGLVDENRRGLATSLNQASMSMPQSLGPSVAGTLFEAGQFVAPFYLAAVLQGVYLVFYGRVFRSYEPVPVRRRGRTELGDRRTHDEGLGGRTAAEPDHARSP